MVTILELGQLTPSQLFYQLFLPFIIILVVFFAVLQMMRIFSRKINLILSIGITLLVATTPVFSTIATVLGRYAGYTVLIAFFIVFGIGVITWTIRRGVEYTTGTLVEVEKLRKEIRKLQDQLHREGNPNKRIQLAREISDKKKLLEELSHYM